MTANKFSAERGRIIMYIVKHNSLTDIIITKLSRSATPIVAFYNRKDYVDWVYDGFVIEQITEDDYRFIEKAIDKYVSEVEVKSFDSSPYLDARRAFLKKEGMNISFSKEDSAVILGSIKASLFNQK